MINLEIRDLRLVRTIAEAGNLTRAAARLNISQSALSRQLLDLEARLGAGLFQRQPRTMSLTETGQRVLALAAELLPRIEQAEQDLASRLKPDTGRLDLGVQCRSCFVWIPEVLKLFHESLPRVTVNVIGTDDYVRDFDLNRIEMVITHQHHDIFRRGFTYEPLYTDEMVFFMATGHPLAQQDQLTLADCSQIDYVSAVDKASDIFYNAYLKPAGIEPKSFTTITQGQSLMNLVAAGHGQAILPRFVIKEMLAGGKLKSVAIAGAIPTPSSWFVAHRENQDLSDYAKAFVALVREFMKTYLA